MRAVVQRVSEAGVSVEGAAIARIGAGLLVLVAVAKGDTLADAVALAAKIAALRIFADEAGKMNLNVGQVGGEILLVSQFTLMGDVRKGNRPAFDAAELPALARTLFESLVVLLREKQLAIQTGQFQAHMQVSLVNEGPVTILLDSRKLF
ncbi:MAG: D-tyrosyl-tRNA(Tyr) deacylase [Bryobacter sp.]|jgi:D-tyrosyl-tRNA(Tyr) deacylase|nr:D-tyrosyl-tRNA(Tyr) deacylase [Bryobacter sp. CoA8 C33]